MTYYKYKPKNTTSHITTKSVFHDNSFNFWKSNYPVHIDKKENLQNRIWVLHLFHYLFSNFLYFATYSIVLLINKLRYVSTILDINTRMNSK